MAIGWASARASERTNRFAPTAISIVKSRKVREVRRAIERERETKEKNKRQSIAKEALAYMRRFVAVVEVAATRDEHSLDISRSTR